MKFMQPPLLLLLLHDPLPPLEQTSYMEAPLSKRCFAFLHAGEIPARVPTEAIRRLLSPKDAFDGHVGVDGEAECGEWGTQRGRHAKHARGDTGANFLPK